LGKRQLYDENKSERWRPEVNAQQLAIDPQTEMRQFLKTSLHAIVRAEADARIPARFTGTGQAVWDTFRNELTAADLTALTIQDAGVTMPVPFDPSRWWPDWPIWALLSLSPADADRWIAEALAQAGQPRDAYLRGQAAALGIGLPPDEAVATLPTPPRHERWLELPGTGGWLAYSLCMRPEADLYFWENFAIVCGTPREVLLAGLIAWELGAPPRTELPIRLDDADLTATLKAGETYHAVMGRRELHSHRDLRVLHPNGEQPLWL
jgi:hypothetical protein